MHAEGPPHKVKNPPRNGYNGQRMLPRHASTNPHPHGPLAKDVAQNGDKEGLQSPATSPNDSRRS